MPQPVQHQQVRPHRHPRSTSAQQSSLERHRRKCAVCHHPERESIEEEFLHWHNPVNIVHEFDLGDRRILYRHAHATGLYEQRRRNYLFTIENVLECGEDIELTASAYIKAVRAYACLCDTVRWTEPATRVQHDYHIHTDSSAAAPPHPVSDPLSSPHSATDSFTVPSFSQAPAAFDNPATKPEPSPNRKIRAANRQTGDSPPASLLPQAALGQPASVLSVPSAFSEARLAEQVKSIVVPSSSPPEAAVDNPARSAVSSSRVTSHEPRPAPAKKQQAVASGSASSVSSADTGEKFLAAAIPLLGAKPKAAAQLKKAGLLHLSELAARHVSPISNRHNLELESPVTPTKQTPEAISNRHKIAK